jgi:DNA mismatch repair protein MutS2
LLNYFPESALTQLEFHKVKELLQAQCNSEYAIAKAQNLLLHSHLPIIEVELRQAHEMQMLMLQQQSFPLHYTLNLQKELKLLGITGAVLYGEQWIQIRKLLETIENIYRWFNAERQEVYTALHKVIQDSYYEKTIAQSINAVIDDIGIVKDNASDDLSRIRMQLHKKRTELRRMFDRIISKLQKAGYVTDIEESFLNGRRVVALFAENKRHVKGILHGQSETGKTAFLEPEETIDLNNDIFELEQDERKEVIRILTTLTREISQHHSLLKAYHVICGQYDFIKAKAKLAQLMSASMPMLSDKSELELINARHPLLLMYNAKLSKPTIPMQVALYESQRIIVISGPNAGGKTVTLKTIGLLQLMMQSGLLVPVDPNSVMGIFKQLIIHIGDTQSLEFELSTYSSHLKNMKHLVENANGRTLFFIDELGGGSDPNLGGAFAEVILEELSKKHSRGIVTTHYLNLKVMANKTQGLVNASMSFDEINLQPLYKLIIGKPGSSYTFSIAERIGLNKNLIERAKTLVNNQQYELDKMLSAAEKNEQKTALHEQELKELLIEQERLNTISKININKEKHKQQVELLKLQNENTAKKLAELKDQERKIKQAVFEWKNAKNKSEAIKNMEMLLFHKKKNTSQEAMEKKFNKKYEILEQPIAVNVLALMKSTQQVAVVKEINGNKAVLQFGLLPVSVAIEDLVAVRLKEQEN